MTELTYLLQRDPSGPTSTIGRVSRDGVFKWFTCEDVVREPAACPLPWLPADVATWKVAAATAIPQGRYRMAFTPSQRFQRETIQLLDVPGFTGIRVHAGNSSTDTEGCLLPGLEMSKGLVFRSRDAVALWEAEVHAALKLAQPVWIEVSNA